MVSWDSESIVCEVVVVNAEGGRDAVLVFELPGLRLRRGCLWMKKTRISVVFVVFERN